MATCTIKRLKPYRDDYHRNKHDPENEDNTYCYQAKGGSWVYIPELINPFSALKVDKNASLGDCKRAFRHLVATPNRQKRMLVAYAWHMLTNEVLYTKGEKSLCDVFDYAICGDTSNLAKELAKHPKAVECTDTSDHSLLYIAARSGFYDTCEFLLSKGASPLIPCGSAKSTPLHAAAYYGHELVCTLLISKGAKVDAKNAYGNTPMDEALNDEVKQKLQGSGRKDKVSVLFSDLKGFDDFSIEDVTHSGRIIARKIRRNREVPKNWLPAWHGTKMKFVLSILKNGLKPSGSEVEGKMIRPPKGHYQLGSTHFGIKNWANAVFISPSLIYSGHPTYSERVLIGGSQWCVVICVLCRPGSFGSYPSTIVRDDPIDGEPEDSEWRVDVEGDDMIWRMGKQSTMECLIVTGVTFVELDFFERIGDSNYPNYRQASKLIHTNYPKK